MEASFPKYNKMKSFNLYIGICAKKIKVGIEPKYISPLNAVVIWQYWQWNHFWIRVSVDGIAKETSFLHLHTKMISPLQFLWLRKDWYLIVLLNDNCFWQWWLAYNIHMAHSYVLHNVSHLGGSKFHIYRHMGIWLVHVQSIHLLKVTRYTFICNFVLSFCHGISYIYALFHHWIEADVDFRIVQLVINMIITWVYFIEITLRFHGLERLYVMVELSCELILFSWIPSNQYVQPIYIYIYIFVAPSLLFLGE